MRFCLVLATLIFNSICYGVGTDFYRLSGVYKLSHPDFGIIHILTIDYQGNVSLRETAPLDETRCKGNAEIKDQIINIIMECNNEQTIVMELDLSGISDFKKFVAPVFSTFFDVEIDMHFERIGTSGPSREIKLSAL